MAQAQPHSLSDVIRHLSAERRPACLLDPGGHFLFVNDAWSPDGDPSALVGRSWLDELQGEEVRRLHAEFLFRALRPPEGKRRSPVSLVVERNSSTQAVLVQVMLRPVLLEGGPLAVAVTHTAVRERPIGEVYEPIDRAPEQYRDPAGAIQQCGCCGRLRHPAEEDRWDLVPAAVEQPPEAAARVLCGMCRELHYGQPPPE
jgi:hypothetical protein